MPDFAFNWTETIKTVASAASVPLLAWYLQRRAADGRSKLDLRTADQKSIEHLSGRVDNLEVRLDKLTGEKMALQVQVIELREQIAQLEIEKREYASRDAISLAQINALEERLAAKEAELRCVQAQLCTLEG